MGNIRKLKSIEIGGYKSISTAKPVKLELHDINILLGANGSGKSNVISFFKMLNAMMNGRFQLFVEQAGTCQVFLNYGAKKTSKISAKLSFEGEHEDVDYEFELSYATPDRLIIASEKIGWGSALKQGEYNSNYKESMFVKTTDAGLVGIRAMLLNYKIYQFHDSSDRGALRQSSAVDGANYLQQEGNNLASFLYYLRENYPTNYKKIVSYIQLVIPQFSDFYLEPVKGYVSLKWRDNSLNDYILLPEQFSDGSIRFIALATLLMQPNETKPFVIIIDEPELGLHPYAINQLAEMIKEASIASQIIVATQSSKLIDDFDADDIAVVEREEKTGDTVINRLKGEDLNGWLENYSMSELWDKNVIGGLNEL